MGIDAIVLGQDQRAKLEDAHGMSFDGRGRGD
jgi:uracil DNA glycosylase